MEITDEDALIAGRAARDAISLQRVNADKIWSLGNVIPPIDWRAVGEAALSAYLSAPRMLILERLPNPDRGENK